MDSIKSLTSEFFRNIAKNGLEIRSGQVEMAEDVCTAIETKKPLAVEAEIGIGKSYAYLVPAVLQFFKEYRQIIIATSTIALQEQLYKDIHNVMEMLGVNAEIILAKGIKNYVCKRRLRGLANKQNDDKLLSKICSFVNDSIQDISSIKMKIPPKVWEKINVSNFGSDYCKFCDFSTSCCYNVIRKKIRTEHNIVICNQNMLVSHLMNEKGIFNPNCSAIIVDEAHNIEEKFRSAFTESYDRIELIYEINKCVDMIQPQDRRLAETLVKSIGKTVNELFKELAGQVQQQKKDSDNDMETFFCNYTTAVKKCVYDLCSKLKRFEKFVNVPTTEILNFAERLKNVSGNDVI